MVADSASAKRSREMKVSMNNAKAVSMGESLDRGGVSRQWEEPVVRRRSDIGLSHNKDYVIYMPTKEA